jgi:hypothetical protein
MPSKQAEELKSLYQNWVAALTDNPEMPLARAFSFYPGTERTDSRRLPVRSVPGQNQTGKLSQIRQLNPLSL